MLVISDAFDLELRRAVIGVVGRIFPVDIVDGKTLGIALDGLGHTGTQA